MSKAILGLGNPLLDISVVADQAFFDKYAIKPATATLAEPKDQPLYDEIVKFSKVGYVAGGATQNSIRGAAWMSPTKGNTHYIGSVGNDDNGKLLASVAEKDGVKTHYYISQKNRTGRCAVLVKDRERSLIADLAAANDYNHTEHFTSDEIQALVKSAHIFYSAGFFLTVSPQTIVEVGKHVLANEDTKILAINLAAVFIINFFWDKLNDVLPYADYVIGNEDEAAAFAEKSGWPKEDLEGCASNLSKLDKKGKRPRTVIFTQGKNDTIVAIAGKVTRYPVPLVDSSLIVDTNGAGDAFVGGFLAGLAADKPLAVCVAAGQYCAGKIIQVEGTQFPAGSTPDFQW
jgi:adenosine kinase